MCVLFALFSGSFVTWGNHRLTSDWPFDPLRIFSAVSALWTQEKNYFSLACVKDLNLHVHLLSKPLTSTKVTTLRSRHSHYLACVLPSLSYSESAFCKFQTSALIIWQTEPANRCKSPSSEEGSELNTHTDHRCVIQLIYVTFWRKLARTVELMNHDLCFGIHFVKLVQLCYCKCCRTYHFLLVWATVLWTWCACDDAFYLFSVGRTEQWTHMFFIMFPKYSSLGCSTLLWCMSLFH